MKVEVNRTKFTTFFLGIAVFLYFSVYWISNSYYRYFVNITTFSNFAYTGAIVLLVAAAVLRRKIVIKTAVLYLLLLFIAIIVGQRQENIRDFLIIIWFMIAGLDVEKNKILRFTFYINMLWFIAIVGGAIFGIIENETMSTIRHGTRYCLGYLTPVAPTVFFFIFLNFIGYKQHRIKNWHLLISFIIAFFLYFQSGVIAALFFSVIAILLIFLLKNMKEKTWANRTSKAIADLIIPFCIIITFVLPVLYMNGNKFAYYIDFFVSNRISLSATALQRYKLTLFGQVIRFNYMASQDGTATYFYVDSSYLKYLLMYGIIFIAVILYAYYCMLKKERENQNAYLMSTIVLSLLYFIFNPQMMYLPYNVYLIIIMQYPTRERINLPNLRTERRDSL